MDYAGHKGLIVPSRGQDDEGRVIPDATFAPSELRLFKSAPSWMPAKGVAMVTEVTSSRPGADRDDKRRAYGAAGIPLYLLADRQRKQITLFSDPAHDGYSRIVRAPFGATLDLPKPFSFTLDTSDFTD
jgi:hypothetical protein